MVITEQELRTLISFKAEIEKISTISSDGKNLLIRIPKKVKDSLGLKKGYKLRWLVNADMIRIEVLKYD
jgi:hypothetical protein